MADLRDGYDDEDDSKDLVFHYKQGSFRKRESQQTRDLALGVSLVKTGIFRSLVSTRGNRFMLMALVACTVLCFAVYLLERSGESAMVGSVRTGLSAFSFEDAVYVSLDFSPSKKTQETKIYDFTLEFRAIATDKSIQDIYKTSYLYENKKDAESGSVTCRFSDYDINKIQCLVKSEGKEMVLETSVKRGSLQ